MERWRCWIGANSWQWCVYFVEIWFFFMYEILPTSTRVCDDSETLWRISKDVEKTWREDRLGTNWRRFEKNNNILLRLHKMLFLASNIANTILYYTYYIINTYFIINSFSFIYMKLRKRIKKQTSPGRVPFLYLLHNDLHI